MRHLHRTGACAVSLLTLVACEGNQSTFTPAGPQSARIETLFWAMTGVGAAVCIAVYVALAYAAWHAGKRMAPLADTAQVAQRVQKPVVLAVAATVIILLAFLGADYATGRPLTSPPRGNELVIEVIGNQWWWDINYKDPVPSRQLNTANEIHIPVGRPVVLELKSRDVIHSIWVPNLTPKRDLVPGYTTSVWLQADRPGIYRGQCAEFCGHQHAKMGLVVIAESPERFARWFNAQLQPHAPPGDSVEQRGHEVFMKKGCILCHTIAGTPAGGRVGPNLSHIGSRHGLAAMSLPNTRGHLAGWIVDPQSVKPGVRMPSNQLSSGDLQALLTYLERLK